MPYRVSASLFLFLAALISTLLMSAAHAQPKGKGLILFDPDQYNSIPLALPPVSGPLPDSADLSASFPRPGFQGGQGSCVAWALGYALKSYQVNKRRRWGGQDPNFVFSPSFIYNKLTASPDCTGGLQIKDALNLLASTGDVPWSTFPYDPNDCTQLPTPSIEQSASPYRIAVWRRVNPQDPNEIKTHIAAGFPIIIGARVYSNFESFEHVAPRTVYRNASGAFLGWHAMVVTGYNDQLNAFKVMNSWGSSWGENGFAWIDYNAFVQLIAQAFVTEDSASTQIPIDQRPNPTPAPIAEFQLNSTVLEASLHLSIDPQILGVDSRGQRWNRRYLWLKLPPGLPEGIDHVEYALDHPTFAHINPLRSEPDSNIFLVTWRGWGCARSNNSEVVAYMKRGGPIKASFNMCEVQARSN